MEQVVTQIDGAPLGVLSAVETGPDGKVYFAVSTEAAAKNGLESALRTELIAHTGTGCVYVYDPSARTVEQVLGGVAALIAAICNGPVWLQIALFFVVSIATLAATRPLVVRLMKKDIKPTNADRVLGGSARVTERIDNDVPTGAVYIDGKTWSARSSTGEIIEPDAMVRVVRMEGVKLYVEKEM